VEPEKKAAFRDSFVELFNAHFQRIFRYLNRLSSDRELAADVAQETFVKLYERGSLPDMPEAWLITVAMNAWRNARTKGSRRMRLLTPARGEGILSDPPTAPDEAAEADELRSRVRSALDRMPERDRQVLLLRAEGYRYREIAAALNIRGSSFGVILARAGRRFRELYEEGSRAPE